MAVTKYWDADTQTYKKIPASDGGGGGGTDVEGNPVGTPTEDLNTLRIGEDIYKIPEGLNNIDLYFGYEKFVEEEIVVGSWIDGRPLYRKIINFGALPNNTTKTISHNIANINYITKCVGAFSDSTYLCSLPYVEKTSSAAGNIALYSTKTTVSIISTSNRSMFSAYIFLEYTKTTDAVNSFNPKMITSNFNTLGIGYENYTTDEICIGRWIDGRPLYRKTINTGTLPNNTTKTVAHGINNLNHVVNMYGYAYRSSDKTSFPLPFVYQLDVKNQTGINVVGNNIQVFTANDRSGIAISYVVLEYTKTTDAANSFTPDMVFSGMLDVQPATDAEVTEVLA